MLIRECIADRFVVQALAGSGGMGKVYRALDQRTSKEVAIKVLSLDANKYSRRFLREAEVMAQLRHKNIVGYVDYGQTERGAPFIVMEWVTGEDLRQRMNRKKVELQDALDILIGVGGALHHAHQHGIIHRDLKPSNLMLVENNIQYIKLLDFGIARWRGPSIEVMTRTGISIGTPGYMAPEQSRGDAEIDGRADLYALGCVVYESLVGYRPFHGEDMVAVLSRTQFDEPPRVSEKRDDISADLDDLLADMMAVNVGRRPANGTILSDRARAIASPGKEKRSATVRPGLSTCERHLMSVVLLDRIGAEGIGAHELQETITRGGGNLQVIDDGISVVTFGNTYDSASDLVLRASRFALDLRAQSASACISLTTAYGDVSGRRSLDKAIVSATLLLRSEEYQHGTEGEPLPIRVDETTTRLLDGRYKIRQMPASGSTDQQGFHLFDEGIQAITLGLRPFSSGPQFLWGREAELGQVGKAIEGCIQEGKPRALLISGAPGIGKSYLLATALSALRSASPEVLIWRTRADNLSSTRAYQGLGHLLEQAAGMEAGDSLDSRAKRLQQRVQSYLKGDVASRVAQTLGEACGVPIANEPVHPDLLAAREDSALMAQQIQMAWEEFLAAVSRVAPLVLILEDLHWTDAPTVQLMDTALSRGTQGPWMLIGAARTDLASRFPAMWNKERTSLLRLTSLNEDACAKLTHEVLGHAPAQEEFRRMAHLADGNPFYLGELCRALKASRQEAIPATVLALARLNLRSLDEASRLLLRAASILGSVSSEVFGGTFSEGGLRRLLGTGGDSIDFPSILRNLVAQKVLVIHESPDAGPGESIQLGFRSDLNRASVYVTLTDNDKQLGHRIAARWLHEEGVRDARILARHFELGNEKESAGDWYAYAARQALAINNFPEAIASAQQGMASGAQGRSLGLLHGCIAQALLWMGDHGNSSEHSLLALENLKVGSGDWARAALDGVTALGRCGASIDIESLGADLVDASKVRGLTGALASAIARAALMLCQSGMIQEAKTLVLHLPEDLTNWNTSEPLAVAHMLGARARLGLASGKLEVFLELGKQSVQAFSQSGDTRNEVLAQIQVGYALVELGDFSGATGILHAALSVVTNANLNTLGSQVRYHLGRSLLETGQLDEAWDLELVAIELFEIQGDDRMANRARVALSKIHQQKESLASAQGQALEALQGTSTAPMVRMQAHAQLSCVLLAMSLPQEALAAAEEAFAILTSKTHSVEEASPLVHLSLIEAYAACGQRTRAAQTLRVACATIVGRSRAISDATLRRSFLEQVADNARLLDLARQWGITFEAKG